MHKIDFPEWRAVLAQAELPGRLKRSFEITIRWYLSFCKRGRADVTAQSARDFIAWAAQEKHPQDWQLEHWKEAIRWFFRAAKDGPLPPPTGEIAGQERVWLPEKKSAWPDWKVAFLTVLRRRKYSYRTEQSYLVWIERFALHLGTNDLGAQGEAQIAAFLDSMALNERLSASSQRQALNALVFLFREVFQRQLGDLGEFRRAKVRTHLPVWLTRDEMQRLFAGLDEPSRLMARVMCGQGMVLVLGLAGRRAESGPSRRCDAASPCLGSNFSVCGQIGSH
jgi:hypothetical protein